MISSPGLSRSGEVAGSSVGFIAPPLSGGSDLSGSWYPRLTNPSSSIIRHMLEKERSSRRPASRTALIIQSVI